MFARLRILLSLATWFVVINTTTAESPTAPRKVYTNKSLFSVPLKIEEPDRARIAQVKCYVKPPGGVWSVHDSGTAQTARFTYQATEDGEYLFSFATIDSTGRESPGNIDREAPRLVVIVDTRPPEFIVASVTVASGQSYVQCTMRDANPDMSTITAEAELADGSFQSLLPVEGNVPGFFRASATGIPNKVRVGGKDKAGNTAVSVLPVLHTNMASKPAASPAQVAALPIPEKPAPTTVVPTLPKLESISAPTAKSNGTGLVLPGSNAKPVAELVTDTMPKPVLPRVVEKTTPIETPPITAPTSERIVNSHRCQLGYAIDGIDPATIEKIEAYASKDNGKTWQKVGDDPDKVSPIELQLPGDGRYGVILVISAANRPGPVPTAGEQPDWIIEADTTAPEVTLESATPGVGDDAGMLILKWRVQDKNLKPDSVDFAWANAPEGPWQTIAKGLRAEGLYRWPVPKEAGSKAYLKIEAQDKAGNVGRAATGQAVSVEVNRPRAKVLGLNPAAMKQ